jgi:amino acid transporter
VITSVVLVLGAVALSVVAGPESISLLAARSGAVLIPILIPAVVGVASATADTQVMLSIVVLGILGAALALQNAIKRQLSGLARDGVLPGRGVDPSGPDRFFLRVAQPVVAGVLAIIGTQARSRSLPLWLQGACALAVFGVLALASVATVVWYLRDEAGFFGWEGRWSRPPFRR